jgi:hypothetical protein
MRISVEFLEAIKDSKIIKVSKVPKGHHTFEYAKEHYKEGQVIDAIELEHEIIGDLSNKVVGYFGINFEHNILAYYLKI